MKTSVFFSEEEVPSCSYSLSSWLSKSQTKNPLPKLWNLILIHMLLIVI